MSKLIGGLKHRYPQEFLEQLAKDLGFEWTRVNFGTIGKDDCPIHPIPPPSGLLFYVDYKSKQRISDINKEEHIKKTSIVI